jgi:hypothetical protein
VSSRPFSKPVTSARLVSFPVAVAVLLCALAGCARTGVPEDRGAPEAGSDSVTLTTPALPPDSLAQPGTSFRPLDEAPRVPGFLEFRQRLVGIVARRDSAALMAIVDPAIKFSFGDAHGSGGFRRAWFGPATQGDVWTELGAVLAQGGTFASDSQFIAPITFAAWPQDLDPFEHLAVIDSGAVVRAAPAADAAALGTLGWQIVRMHGGYDARENGWIAIDRGAAPPGYVAAGALRSPVGYRVFFERRGGRWRMTLFVAGD